MKYPAYPKYKDSGVAWLGEVPGHWEVKRLKMTAHHCDKKVEANEENPLPYIGMENIESWSGKLLPIDPDIVPSGVANYFSKGTTLFGKLRPYLAKSCNPDFEGLCSTELLVIQAEDFDRRALLYWLLADGFIKLVDSSTYGSKMPRANWDFIGNCQLPVPPLTEQTAIAGFLDRETGRIDTLVAKKRKLVELLKEKRSALISRTVTRGLPADAAREFGLTTGNAAVHEAPGAYDRGHENHSGDENFSTCRGEKFFAPTGNGIPGRLKDSGVEWLGEIPVDWVTPPLYSRYSIELGKMLNESKITGKHLLPYLRNIDVQWDSINFIDLPEMDIPEPEYSRYTLKEGDLLVCEGGEVGRSAIVGKLESKIGFQKALHRMRAINSLMEYPRYMYYLMYWANKTGVFSSGGISTIAHLTGEQLRKYRFPKPPFQEQTAIATYLDRETAKIDRLVEKVETAITRLQEYRSALIIAAVTGKIDVREAR
ncbi:restriction endonuclease subunit S [Methylomonas sp. SURF-2]|uniref:Restriction endonuclease subunit S n=1 Tax=Methylomonas subterranea TaxID=2952225 RepID=A0ABT1TJ04_9GAMM|nr:restriction endonuclease subunit S [Methylomonas sp. SURF-2]MCQ8105448.1 restriction endonuclease subunit S [Methylomonas sp. SURF-2]